MLFQRVYIEGLAQASFVLGCDRTRDAVVIDPRRDIDVYVEFARQHDLRITHAIETHIHADFVSGARELQAIDATTVSGPGAGLRFPHHEAAHDETLAVGEITLRFLHTPGHTPEHIAILATAPGEPARLFTGDLLFVGAVGRPDLLGIDLSRALATQLYDSLYRIVLGLDDAVEVHPGHGAGSLCGKGIGTSPSSTIGQERRMNPWLHYPSREAFVDAVVNDLPETPPYFPLMKKINHAGPEVLNLATPPRLPEPMDAREAARRADAGAVLLDVRDADSYGAAHAPGALNIGFGSRLGYWAGWVIPIDAPVILVTDDERHLGEALRQLLRVGIDRVQGHVTPAAWADAGLPVARTQQVAAAQLAQEIADGRVRHVIDVRTTGEFTTEHLPGAVNIPVGEVPLRMSELPADRPLVTICEAGYRSSIAASLLERAGIGPVVNAAGGMAAAASQSSDF